MKKLMALLTLLLAVACAPASIEKPLHTEAVPLMPDTSPEMLTAGFWIAKTPFPDELIMTSEEISTFNKEVLSLHRLQTPSGWPEKMKRETVKTSITSLYNVMSKQKLYYTNGSAVTKADFEALLGNCNVEGPISPEIAIQPAIITSNISQRVLPTERVMIRENSSRFFDRLQMSSLDLGTPVMVLWESADTKWYFVRSTLTSGWVKAEYVAFCTSKEVNDWESAEAFAITVRAKTSVYADDKATKFLTWLPMGNKVFFDPKSKDADGYAAVLIPVKGETGWLMPVTGYIKREELHAGYLPYTSRTILTQAFEMLNAPYGWGGMYGEQDCSAYLIRVFNCVGVTLPRNSKTQGNTGEILYSAEADNVLTPRQAIFFFGTPGATLVHMQGHIMLYVGSITAEPYVIHSMWAFREDGEEENYLKIPARVVLSSLKIGSTNGKGPYQDRVINVRNIKTWSNK